MAVRVILATLLMCCTAASVAADPGDEANALIAKANALRLAGDDLGAIPLLLEAYRIYSGPRSAVQLGLAEYAVGRWADADRHLTEALKASDDPWIRKNRQQIVEALRIAKTHVGRVEVTGDPPGAEVLVNGRVAGRLPLAQPVAVSAGSVDLEVRAPGYQPRFRTISVNGGQYQPVVIRLEAAEVPVVDGPVTGRLPPGTQTMGPGGPGPLESLASVADPGEVLSSRWRPLAISIALGGAGLGAAIGGYGLWQYDRHASAFNQRQCFETKTGAAVLANGAKDSACTKSMNSYRKARVVEIAGFTAAGAFAVTAALVYLLAPAGDAPAHRSGASGSLVCLPGLPGAGLGCALHF